MEDWKEILDSPIIKYNGYVSWEEYMRLSVSSEGIIYPMYAYDEKYILEPLLVGFVFIPSPPMLITTEFGDVTDEVMPIFFDHDNVMMFDAELQFRGSFGRYGWDDGELRSPDGIATDGTHVRHRTPLRAGRSAWV